MKYYDLTKWGQVHRHREIEHMSITYSKDMKDQGLQDQKRKP